MEKEAAPISEGKGEKETYVAGCGAEDKGRTMTYSALYSGGQHSQADGEGGGERKDIEKMAGRGEGTREAMAAGAW